MRELDDFAVAGDTHVQTTADKLWAVVSDITLPVRFSSELKAVSWLEPATEVAVGAQFVGENVNPQIGQWWTVSEVVDVEPARMFGWAVLAFGGSDTVPARTTGQPLVHWQFVLTPDGDGVRLEHRMWLTGERSGLHEAVEKNPERAVEIVAWRRAAVADGIDEMLRGIKALAEA